MAQPLGEMDFFAHSKTCGTPRTHVGGCSIIILATIPPFHFSPYLGLESLSRSRKGQKEKDAQGGTRLWKPDGALTGKP